MSQSKKIFTGMCLNNWGGINHRILQFNEYVNLFSGKSGSGKSTVMDAIQVILYGSFSPSFLNKAADDAKNRRSVLSYLRGEQKDGSANREGCDFCSVIALEIMDTGSSVATCIGIAFEVRKNDSEIKKFVYFSHSGSMPESGYVTEDGLCYSNQDIRKLVKERSQSDAGRGKGDVNRIYASKEAYLGALYDVILGYIDPNRFITMEKSAIALKMTNGTGQFIRDYMFPKSDSGTIESISEQLDAYRQIKDKIEDMRRRIELLKEIKASGRELVRVQADIAMAQAMIRCIDIEDMRAKIAAAEDDKLRIEAEQLKLQEKAQELSIEQKKLQNEYIQVSADLKSGDLGSKKEQLKELKKRSLMLTDNSHQWIKITSGLKRWEDDEVITDYVSNKALNLIDEITGGSITEENCEQLHLKLESVKQTVEDELEDNTAKKNEIARALREKERLVEDMKNNRKSYKESLRSARAALQRALSDRFGETARVYIFADMFDVTDDEWKNAIEGRMGRLKFSLITEPRYANTAASVFRDMKQFEEVDLINSGAILDSAPKAMDNSLYEAVSTNEKYVDACLKRYLGHIIKCRSVDELSRVKDGVTPDCYSYSNFIFRHLKKRDYTTNACIGGKVSKARLAEYEADVDRLEAEQIDIMTAIQGLKAQRDFECLKGEPEYYVGLSKASDELELVNAQKLELEEVIKTLEEGQYKELKAKKELLEKHKEDLERAQKENRRQMEEMIRQHEKISGVNEQRGIQLEDLLSGYVANPELEAQVHEQMKNASGQSVKNKQRQELISLQGADGAGGMQQACVETLQAARYKYLKEFPSGQFSGVEKSNEAYEALLDKYETDYEPEYEKEFDKQCDFIYRSLRENVIATIHGDIKAAKRHAYEINRLLRETNFSDSTYQIKIEPAKNENGQFYDMLMAEELDSKNLDNGGIDGQISFGEDDFYKKYEQKIQLLTDKFMPPKDEDEHQRMQKRKEMEQYADYRNYLSFSMYEQVTDENGQVIRENFVDDMAGRDSGGEGQNPKYVALLAGFAMLYMQQSNRDSKIKLVLLDEAFSKMDQERSAVCLKYARKMDLQLIVCVPDERLQSLIRNVDCVYGFRRHNNQISMMHIDKGDYLKLMEG
ncbi:MAG: SbcC/MukB-like Walker B domain-containing protein [Agathobacter sp.]|uniref:SbcC/MukB-like Walker B domain-containing protein n=1 Tax=Agathobacter sp. TaxID=2021311 RepID=UPI002E7A7B6B|nr:SbcC/MukB-like Walker B domain-containing protein [Agathobacter sp.]MEE1217852.1 SbcC/MukB-like Walker B domain-containing protein [Agathobacter sp.]